MTAFVDSSAFAKVYLAEAGHAAVRRLPGAFVVSALTRVEVVSAFWRKHRTGEIESDAASVFVGAFEADLRARRCSTGQAIVTVPIGQPILDMAAAYTGLFALRAYDAVQLASAKRARAVDPHCTDFLTFDHALARAARAEGFAVRP